MSPSGRIDVVTRLRTEQWILTLHVELLQYTWIILLAIDRTPEKVRVAVEVSPPSRA